MIVKILEALIEQEDLLISTAKGNTPTVSPGMEFVVSYHQGKADGLRLAIEIAEIMSQRYQIKPDNSIAKWPNFVDTPADNKSCKFKGHDCSECEYLNKCLDEERGSSLG